MIRIQRIASDVARRDAENWNPGGFCDLFFKAVQMCVYGLGFPSGVGENRVVDLGEDAVGGEG